MDSISLLMGCLESKKRQKSILKYSKIYFVTMK